jgi:hypothetical protein
MLCRLVDGVAGSIGDNLTTQDVQALAAVDIEVGDKLVADYGRSYPWHEVPGVRSAGTRFPVSPDALFALVLGGGAVGGRHAGRV